MLMSVDSVQRYATVSKHARKIVQNDNIISPIVSKVMQVRCVLFQKKSDGETAAVRKHRGEAYKTKRC
jgi:hypothetical protein